MCFDSDKTYCETRQLLSDVLIYSLLLVPLSVCVFCLVLILQCSTWYLFNCAEEEWLVALL